MHLSDNGIHRVPTVRTEGKPSSVVEHTNLVHVMEWYERGSESRRDDRDEIGDTRAA